MSGKLFLVATPIGNLGDISERAKSVLSSVDVIAAEDTRNSIKLLNYLNIKVPLTSYHKFNSINKAYELIDTMKEGKDIALITDAGMPAISDPGEDLVRLCYEAGIEVTIVPGPCACVSALALSGLETTRFCFEAFLPYEKKKRTVILDELKSETRTIIIYEAPHKLLKLLSDLVTALGPDRRVSIVRELTKIHEEVLRMTLSEALANYESMDSIKGEYVLVVEGKDRRDIETEQRAQWNSMTIAEHVDMYEKTGMEHKEAMKQVAEDRGISKRDVYQALLKEEYRL